MKTRILSFLLMLVMVVLAVPAFVLPSLAAEVPVKYSSAWLDYEPTVDVESGVVTFYNPWTIGYKTDATTLVPFGKYAPGGGADAKLISSTGEDQWGNGGYYSVKYGNMNNAAIVAGKYVAYRYTAEYTGKAVLSVTDLSMLDMAGQNNASTGIANSAFAIAVNGEVKWPVGATYGDTSTWHYDEYKDNGISEISDTIDDVTVSLTAGDAVEFLFARVGSGSWSHAGFKPVVTYTTKDIAAPELPYTSKWIDAYPTVSGSTVTYPTEAWAVGYSAIGKNDFHAFDQVQSDLIRAYGMYEWTYGGMFYNNKNVGGTWYYGGVLIAGAKNQYASSYRYVAEYTGTATLSAENLVFIDAEVKTGVANAAMAVMLNGEVIWPAGAKANDVSTWYYAGANINVNLAAELGEITLKLNKGDWVEFKFATVNSGWATNDFKPVITYTDIDMSSCNVTYVDENGALIANYATYVGDAFPICPINAFWDVDGDGKADTLPTTVDAWNTTVKLVYRATQTSTSINPSVVNGKVVASSVAGWDTVIIKSSNQTLPAKDAVRHVPDSTSTAGGFTWAYPSTLCEGAGPNDSNPGFILSGSGSWYPVGSAIASWQYTAGWRYTATYSGVADVTVDILKNVGQWASAEKNSQFVILKNGEKIWPTDTNWYVFNTKDENMAETIMASAADVLTGITLKKGDTLEFLTSDVTNAWGNQFTGSFTVSYREAPASSALQSGAVALGEKFAPIYTVDSTTVPAGATNVGLYANGIFYPAAEGMVTLPGVAAKNLTDDLDVTVAYTVDGAEIYGKTYTYSVADLLMQYVTDNAADTASNLAIATLNYAAAAQTYFGYNTANLANAGLTDAQKAATYTGDYDDNSYILPKEATANSEYIIADVYGVKLMLNDTVDMAVYFKSDIDLTAIDCQMGIVLEGVGVQFVDIEITKVGNDLYKVILPGLTPAMFGTTFMFALATEVGGEQMPLSEGLFYSVADYCKRMQGTEIDAVVDAMLALYEAAAAYTA